MKLTEDEMESAKCALIDEMNEGIREEIYTDVIQEFDYIIDLQLSDDQKQAIISDIVDYVCARVENNEVRFLTSY